MAVYEGSIPSLLQGVSQQVPRERLDGQVGIFHNMLADAVTGVRRRPSSEYSITMDFGSVDDDALFTQYLEKGDDGGQLVINTNTGRWWVLDETATTRVTSGTDAYFVASGGRFSIQTTSLGGKTFILNTEQAPNGVVDNTGKIDPNTAGFFFVKSSMFNKEYTLKVTSDNIEIGENKSHTAVVSYKTPKGTETGDADKSTPEKIAEELAKKLIAATTAVTVQREGAYIFVSGMKNGLVESDSGTLYVGVSNRSRVNLESDLPARLPANGNGYICAVGTKEASLAWYTFNREKRRWDESGSYGSVTKINNMPRELTEDGVLQAPDYEGRLAGDDNTNESPTFLKDKLITGMGTFQGRLVLLSGAYVCMSKSGNAKRFYRSTVTELQDADRIDIASGSAQNSVFRQAIQFNRDLVLIGDSMQAVIPTGAGLLSPNNASIVLTSELSCDSRVMPVLAGQTVLYATRRSYEYAGMLELIPSQYTASQYMSQDVTMHIPRFMAGRLRTTASSNVNNMVVVGGSGDMNTLYVYEYQWGSEGKLQAAWHSWSFGYKVLSHHFAREKLVMFLANDSNEVHVIRLDPREGYDQQSELRLPYLDLYTDVELENGKCYIPEHLRSAVQNGTSIGLAHYGEDRRTGDEVGIADVNLDNFEVTAVQGTPDGTYYIGLKYKSAVSPTPPMLKDQDGKVFGTGRTRLMRFEMVLQNSGTFQVAIKDTSRDVDRLGKFTGVIMNSVELAGVNGLWFSNGSVQIPCRSNADTTALVVLTDSTRELNILDISYLIKYNSRARKL